MFRPSEITLNCPHCGFSYQAPVFSIVDVGETPELKQLLLTGRLNASQCPNCRNINYLATPLLYHDPEHEFLAVFMPAQLNMTEVQRQKAIGDLTKALMDALPPEKRRGYMLSPQQFLSMDSLGEKILGLDGVTPEMIEASKRKAQLVEELARIQDDSMAFNMVVAENKELLDNYKPAQPKVGVMFSPQSYYLNWAQEGNANLCMNGLLGYTKGLIRQSIPYLVVEEEHLNVLSGLKILFLPRMIVSAPSVEDALSDFVRSGGTLLCESECGAFSPEGIYRYPEDRFIAQLSGVSEVGRRNLYDPFIKVRVDGEEITLKATQWLTPWRKERGRILSENEDGALVLEVPVGKGKVILCGSYFGDPYLKNWSPDFEKFLRMMVYGAGVQFEVEVVSPKPSRDSFVYVKWGESEGRKVVFVFSPPLCRQVHLKFKQSFFKSSAIKDLISGEKINIKETNKKQECVINPSKWGINILVEE